MLARVCTAIGLIGVVVAVVVSIADVGRVGADAGATLELAGSTLEVRCSGKTKVWTRARAGQRLYGVFSGLPRALTAVRWFIGSVAAVVLSVTLPPKGNALVILTHELERKRIHVRINILSGMAGKNKGVQLT